MYGFDIIVNGIKSHDSNDITYRNALCINHMINKFQEDRLFQETDGYIVILDGVILNRKDLLKQYNSDWLHCIIMMYSGNGESFFSELRGSFSGAIYDKKQDKWIVFGDQLGTRFTFYSHVGKFFCVTEEMGHMYDILKENKIQYSLSSKGAYMLLGYGFMTEENTLCSEVKKIQPGCYIVFKDNQVTEKRYFMLDNTELSNVSEAELLKEVDNLFRQAVIRQFEKDKEYGCKHLVALSSGLDSRMTSFVAHECGYQDQLNYTFSQTGSWDEKTPKEIAESIRHEWIFKALDNGLWLYDVDKITKTTGGNVLYYGTAHGDSLYKYLNFDNIGLTHSGQLGDVILGTTVHPKNKKDKFIYGEGSYSRDIINRIGASHKVELNKEVGLFYYRYLNGTNNGLQNVYNYTDSLSPFMDLDFIQYALRIPASLRYNHYLYKKWIINYYPNAALFVWDKLDGRITDRFWSKEIYLLNRKMKIRDLCKVPAILFQKLLLPQKYKLRQKNSMNPIDYYISTNEQLNSFLDSYLCYIEEIKDEKLQSLTKSMMSDGNAYHKIQAVSLLSAVKMYFME